MIPENHRIAIIDNYVRGLLNSDRCTKNFLCLERLWEASGLSNKDLVEELLSDRENAADDFREAIFWDMVWSLKNAIIEDEALRSLFSDLYAKRYPRADKYIQDLERKVGQGKRVLFGDAEFNKFYGKHSLDETGYLVFRVFTSDVLVTNDCIDHDYYKYNYEHARKFLDRESQAGDRVIVFTDGSNAPVFESKFFERFVKKQKQALADYLNVDIEKLGSFYDSVMTIEEDPEGNSIAFSETAFGRISASMVELIWLHGGSGFWLANIQSLNRKNKYGFKYRPDFDKLFEKYCRANIVLDYPCFIRDEGTFTPLTLARKCGFEELEALAVSMGYMYMCDIMHQMYIQMQKQYYANFSWEKLHNSDLRTRYEAVIADLKASLSLRDTQLHNTRLLYNTLRETLEKKNDLALIKEVQDKERILKNSEEKDAEIERLKGIIASQNQLIEQLQTPEDLHPEEDGSRFDVDSENIIYQHKYLFVGDITSLGFEELKRKFPSSIFMESNTANISQVQVDTIVYLIQAMGHSMYYKCKNTPVLQCTKVIYYNGRGNIISLFETMERELQKSEPKV